MRRLQLDSDDESEDNNQEQNLQDELACYLNMPAMENDGQKKEENICHWCKKVGNPLPSLCKGGQSGSRHPGILNRFGTGLYSTAGLTLASRRSSMNPEHVNELLVVRSFFKNEFIRAYSFLKFRSLIILLFGICANTGYGRVRVSSSRVRVDTGGYG